MHYELSSNSHWGSGRSCVPASARRGFETSCNDFFIFALASIAEIPTWIFMIVIETTFTIIDCIGDYYFNIDTIESYAALIY